MKKQLVASLAAAMVLGVAGSAFAAANPFVDVPAKHWSYDSVTKLAQAGIVDGYGNGQFQGDKTMTRYEMAQIVAKAMGKSDKADAAMKAEITKLQAEYADELNKIGVRVDALEKNQANLKFTGNFLLRYQSKDDIANADRQANAFYRLRLDGSAKVDDQTTFNLRYVTSDVMKGAPKTYLGLPGVTGSTSKFGNENTDNVQAGFDRYNIVTKMNDFTVTAGRQALVVGTTSAIVDSGAFSYDGLKVATPVGKVNAVVNYGRLIEQKDLVSLELSTTTGKLTYGAGLFNIKDRAGVAVGNWGPDATTSIGNDVLKLQYANATYNFDTKFSMTTEFGQNKANYATSNNKFINVWALYGDQVLNAKGKNNIKVQYWSVGNTALGLDSQGRGMSTLDTAKFYNGTGTVSANKLSGWDFSYNHAFSKTFYSELHYVPVKTDAATDAYDYKYIRLNVVAKF